MATHSSVLAWRIPGMGEPGGLLSLGSHRVGHDWNDLAAAYTYMCVWLCVCVSVYIYMKSFFVISAFMHTTGLECYFLNWYSPLDSQMTWRVETLQYLCEILWFLCCVCMCIKQMSYKKNAWCIKTDWLVYWWNYVSMYVCIYL